MFERFTATSRAVVARAVEAAGQTGAPLVDTEHLLLALLDERAGVAYRTLHAAGITRAAVTARLGRPGWPGALTDADAEALRGIGIDLDTVLARIGDSFGADALRVAGAGPSPGRSSRRFTPDARKALALAVREAVRLGGRAIDDGHLLLGLLRGECRATRLLAEAGASVETLRASVENAYRTAA